MSNVAWWSGVHETELPDSDFRFFEPEHSVDTSFGIQMKLGRAERLTENEVPRTLKLTSSGYSHDLQYANRPANPDKIPSIFVHQSRWFISGRLKNIFSEFSAQTTQFEPVYLLDRKENPIDWECWFFNPANQKPAFDLLKSRSVPDRDKNALAAGRIPKIVATETIYETDYIVLNANALNEDHIWTDVSYVETFFLSDALAIEVAKAGLDEDLKLTRALIV